MKTRAPAFVGVLLAGCASWAQAAQPLAFEVASVKPAVPGPWRESKVGADRIDFPGVTLRYCLAFAYGLKEYQVFGPSWLGELKYDIVAKGAGGTSRDQLPEMMQALLVHRFKLQVHPDTKEFNVFALVVGKGGPKLKESPPPEPGAEAAGARFGISMSQPGGGRLEAKNATMAALANTLVRITGRPVVDKTELTGRYDFDLEFSLEDASAMRVAAAPPVQPQPVAEPGPSIFGSILRFGLRLDDKKLPLNTIVVDSAEKVPSEN